MSGNASLGAGGLNGRDTPQICAQLFDRVNSYYEVLLSDPPPSIAQKRKILTSLSDAVSRLLWHWSLDRINEVYAMTKEAYAAARTNKPTNKSNFITVATLTKDVVVCTKTNKNIIVNVPSSLFSAIEKINELHKDVGLQDNSYIFASLGTVKRNQAEKSVTVDREDGKGYQHYHHRPSNISRSKASTSAAGPSKKKPDNKANQSAKRRAKKIRRAKKAQMAKQNRKAKQIRKDKQIRRDKQIQKAKKCHHHKKKALVQEECKEDSNGSKTDERRPSNSSRSKAPNSSARVLRKRPDATANQRVDDGDEPGLQQKPNYSFGSRRQRKSVGSPSGAPQELHKPSGSRGGLCEEGGATDQPDVADLHPGAVQGIARP